jgi:hypothetical protein
MCCEQSGEGPRVSQNDEMEEIRGHDRTLCFRSPVSMSVVCITDDSRIVMWCYVMRSSRLTTGTDVTGGDISYLKLRQRGLTVNHKRIERLYAEA